MNFKLLCVCLVALLSVDNSSAAREPSEALWAKEEREAYASGELVKNPDFGFFYFVRWGLEHSRKAEAQTS